MRGRRGAGSIVESSQNGVGSRRYQTREFPFEPTRDSE